MLNLETKIIMKRKHHSCHYGRDFDNILCLWVKKVVRHSQFLNCGEVEIVCFDGVGEIVLGWYSSEEKALKVLCMIESKYINIKRSEFLGCENESFENPIFEMPKDDEVI